MRILIFVRIFDSIVFFRVSADFWSVLIPITDFTISYNTDCEDGFYRYLDWKNFYVGGSTSIPAGCKLVESNDGVEMTVNYNDCDTQISTEQDHIETGF